MKKTPARKTDLKQLQPQQLAAATGGDNPGMGPYDAPTAPSTTSCWIQMSDGKGTVYMPNNIVGADCPLVEA